MYSLFNDFSDMAAEILRRAQQHGDDLVFSFDVFDTLIHRRTAPRALLEAVGREICHNLLAHGIEPVCDAMAARDHGYQEIAARFVAQGLDTDAHLDDLVLPWVRRLAGGSFDGDEALARRMIEREIELESWASFPNAIMLRLLTELKAYGVRVILTSDMYLGKKYVDRLLSQHGYAGLYERLFVSCDIGMLKRTGRMFQHVSKTLGVPSAKIIHVGDNLLSDGVMATKAGLQAMVIRDRSMIRRFERLEYDLRRMRFDRNWKGVAAAAYAQIQPGRLGTPQEAFGLRLLGPILVPFIHSVAERCQNEGIRRVYFLAREGLILKQIFELVAPLVFHDQPAPEAVYLATSRLPTFLAAMDPDHFGLREIASSLANARHYSLRNLVQPLKLDTFTLLRIAERAGISDIDAALPHNFMSWPPLAAVFRDPEFKAAIALRATRAREGLYGYLEQIGFLGSTKVALVDVGWGGQIQDNITVAIETHPARPQIFGMYLGLNPVAHTRKSPNSWMEGLVCDSSHPEWFGWAAFEFVIMFETMTRALHGTIVGYKVEADDYIPIEKADDDPSRRTEIEDESLIACIQQGVLDFTAQYVRAATIFAMNAADALPYARSCVARAVRFPSGEEADWILGFRNISDLGSSETITLGGPRPSFMRPRAIRRLLAVSFWPYGLVRRSFGTPGQMLIALKRGQQMLAPRHVPLVSGIVWHTPAQSREKMPVTETKPEIFACERLGLERQKLMQAMGTKRGNVIDLHGASTPLSSHEMLPAHLVYLALHRWAIIKKRHIPHRSCISLKGLIARDYGTHTLSKFLRAVRRRVYRL